MPKEDVDHLVLVGGLTRVPKLRSLIEELFKNMKAKSCKAVNPDEAVARGAALLAANRVKIDVDVTPLVTQVVYRDKTVRVEPNSPLPCRVKLDAFSDCAIQVHQGKDRLRCIFQRPKLNQVHSCHLNCDSIFEFLNGKGEPLPKVLLSNCLSATKLRELKEKVQKEVKAEEMESKRMEIKNSLEDLLRRYTCINLEVEDDGLEAVTLAQQLQDKCHSKLTLLKDSSNKPSKTFDDLINEVKKDIEGMETERQKFHARKALEHFLHNQVLLEISGGKSPEASKLSLEYQATLDWMEKEAGNASHECYTKRKADIEELLCNLQLVRINREKAQKEFEDMLKEFTNNQEIPSDSNFAHQISCAVQDEFKWLSSEEYHSQEELLKHTHNLQLKVQKLKAAYNQDMIIKEKQRKSHLSLINELKFVQETARVFKNLEQGNQCTSFYQEYDRLWTTLNTEHQLYSINLKDIERKFRGTHHDHMVVLKGLVASKWKSWNDELQAIPTDIQGNWVSKYLDECRRKLQDFEDDARSMTASEIVDNFSRLEEQQTEYLSARTRVVERKLRESSEAEEKKAAAAAAAAAASARFDDGTVVALQTPAGTPHRLDARGEQEEPAGQSAGRVVTQQPPWPPCSWSTSGGGGLENSHRHASAERGPAGPASESRAYDPLLYEEKTAEDVEMADGCNGEQTLGSAPQHRGHHQVDDGLADDIMRGFLKEFASSLIQPVSLLSLPRPFELTVDETIRMSVGSDPSSSLLLDNQAVLLQCLAEEVAVDALRQARAADCMALLVHKARTPDGRDLLSLAVRYVRESGKPFECLIVVIEASASRETSDAHRLFDSFIQLCMKADVFWQQRLICGVSVEGGGAEGREFLRLLRESVETENFEQRIPELVDSAVPMDERIALACYAEGADWDAFFRTVDDFREFFSVKSRFNRLKEVCACTVTEARWSTYEGSLWVMVYKLLEDKEKKLKDEIHESEPATKFRLEMLFDRLRDNKFQLQLAAMNLVFHALKDAGVKDGQGRPYPANLDFDAWLIKLEGVSFEGSPATKLAADDHRCTMDEAKDVARRVLEACRRECAPYLHPLARLHADPVVKPRAPRPLCKDFEVKFPRFRSELDRLTRQHGHRLSNSSPRKVVGALLRGEFPREDFPTLRSVLVRALTVPLLPCGTPRARDALRDSARALSACPSDRLGAVIVLQQESAQDLDERVGSGSFFEAVVRRLRGLDPELGLGLPARNGH